MLTDMTRQLRVSIRYTFLSKAPAAIMPLSGRMPRPATGPDKNAAQMSGASANMHRHADKHVTVSHKLPKLRATAKRVALVLFRG